MRSLRYPVLLVVLGAIGPANEDAPAVALAPEELLICEQHAAPVVFAPSLVALCEAQSLGAVCWLQVELSVRDARMESVLVQSACDSAR
jgi:hypothetical protein